MPRGGEATAASIRLANTVPRAGWSGNALPAGLLPVMRRALRHDVVPRGRTTWRQQAKLTIDQNGTFFAQSVALSGDTALVGANDTNNQTGAAYVFVRRGTTWSQQAELTATDGAPQDFFGQSVALSGNTALVGAWSSPGAAYVFVRRGTAWTQQARLTASDGAAADQFGFAVALNGDTALVGAYDHNLTGAAYVFVRRGTTWTQQAELTARDSMSGDAFGNAVSLSGDSAVIGAYQKNNQTGAAYVFVRHGTAWAQQAELTARDGAASDFFGASVAMSGDTALVGASELYTSKPGTAYVFVRHDTTWIQQAKLTASDGTPGDLFGYRVAFDGGTALVGAWSKPPIGAAYVFVRCGTAWMQQARLAEGPGAKVGGLGWSVALSGETALVGANNGIGAAYVFVRGKPGQLATQTWRLPAAVQESHNREHLRWDGPAQM